MRLSPIAQVSTSRSTVLIKGIVILIFLLLAELRTCSAMSSSVSTRAFGKETIERKKSGRVRHQLKKKQHAVVYACSYKRKAKSRPNGFSYYR